MSGEQHLLDLLHADLLQHARLARINDQGGIAIAEDEGVAGALREEQSWSEFLKGRSRGGQGKEKDGNSSHAAHE